MSGYKASHPSDDLLALGTIRCITVVIALGTEDGAPLLKEASLLQNHLTLGAGELLRVPGAPQGNEIASPEPPPHTHRYRHTINKD